MRIRPKTGLSAAKSCFSIDFFSNANKIKRDCYVFTAQRSNAFRVLPDHDEVPSMFKVITDTSANLDQQWLIENDVPVIPFHYYVGGKDNTCTNTRGFDGAAFYSAMRAGEKVTTSQITPQAYLDTFRPILEGGQDILYVSMSSGISGSYSQSQFAARELKEKRWRCRLPGS